MTARIVPPPRDQLAALYEHHGSTRAVAAAMGSSATTVLKWLAQYQIARRPVGWPGPSGAPVPAHHPWRRGLARRRAA